MKKKFNIGTIIALMLLMAAVTFVITYLQALDEFNAEMNLKEARDAELKNFNDARIYLSEFHVGEDGDLLVGAIQGMLDATEDPWSAFLDAGALSAYKEHLQARQVGIGATFAHDFAAGGLRVLEILSGSEAEKAGLRSFDLICEVDGVSVLKNGYYHAVGDICGPESTTVRLTVRRENSTLSMEVRRHIVSDPAIHSEILEQNIGYIRVRSFEAGSDAEFKENLTRLETAGVEGLIIDLRFSQGGNLKAMVSVMDYLLPEGNILQVRNEDERVDMYASDAFATELPVAVLVNGYTTGISEFFAAAFQETGHGTVVGTNTRGKSYAQVELDLNEGTGLYLSTQEYLTGLGRSLKDTGMAPNVTVEMSESLGVFAQPAAQDAQVQAAVAAVVLSRTSEGDEKTAE